MPSTRSYTAGFKLHVVKMAKETNNSQVAKKYGVTQKMVIDWRNREEALKRIPKKKCARRSGIAHWPELENYLAEWVRQQRQNSRIIRRTDVRDQAMKWARFNQHVSSGFTATTGWRSRFMKSKDLVMRQRTKVAQKMPVDLGDKLRDFRRYVRTLRREHNFLLGSIGNMDETPVFFDMLGNRTVDSKGMKSVIVKSSGHERTRFTVVLSCLANGMKLKLVVIFKRKRRPKEDFPSGAFVHFHENGWMDEQGVRLWIDNIWRESLINLFYAEKG
ncbi:hypothetical protein M513_12028 [Trichuris suis]|uniref:HTH CENPB-type domain-containing protein n=1 Tax=Trichuris suis TaxID=68888 RepID=A0A085LQ72_9BILA|nr:hypothetical protein M513_12028 [Trichuris suis]